MKKPSQVTMYAPSHKTKQSGDEEAIGFFCMKIDFDPVWGNPRLLNNMPNPKRWDSLYDAIAWAERKYGSKLNFQTTAIAEHGIPIQWRAVFGQTLLEILYIGAYKYPAGHLVNPLIVGTDMENFGGVTN